LIGWFVGWLDGWLASSSKNLLERSGVRETHQIPRANQEAKSENPWGTLEEPSWRAGEHFRISGAKMKVQFSNWKNHVLKASQVPIWFHIAPKWSQDGPKMVQDDKKQNSKLLEMASR
jgi:hypothetical protein